MKSTFAEIRAALVRSEGVIGRPYPEGPRRTAVALVERERAKGTALTRIAAGLGTSATTLRKWMREEAAPQDARARFREVEILASPPAPSPLVLHGPYGLRIEGATIADVAELLRRLV